MGGVVSGGKFRDVRAKSIDYEGDFLGLGEERYEKLECVCALSAHRDGWEVGQ
jgi:hypothetical protein